MCGATVSATARSKFAEQELRESEARYRALAESSPLALFVNREDRVVLANPGKRNAIDIAMWDAAGKTVGVPLYRRR